jgi:hypothetical protein
MRRVLVISAALVIASALCAPLVAQVVVEEGVTTDTVELFGKSNVPEKSGVLAMGASLLFPGLGQQYLGQESKAFLYYSMEALFIFGAVYCHYNSKKVFDDAKAYASAHAAIEGGSGANDQFWQDVGQYDGSDDFNNVILLDNRNLDGAYLATNLQWRWDDPANRKTTYSSYIKNSLRYDVASSFFIGAMILNRLVSFVDARFASRHQHTSLLSSLRVFPGFDPCRASSGIVIKTTF